MVNSSELFSFILFWNKFSQLLKANPRYSWNDEKFVTKNFKI